MQSAVPFFALWKRAVYHDYSAWQQQSRDRTCPNGTLCITAMPNTVSDDTARRDMSHNAQQSHSIPSRVTALLQYIWLHMWCGIIVDSKEHLGTAMNDWKERATATVEWWYRWRQREAAISTGVVHSVGCTKANYPIGAGRSKRQPSAVRSSMTLLVPFSTEMWCDNPHTTFWLAATHPRAHHLSLYSSNFKI